MSDISDTFAATIERFSGFPDDYDRHRPQPPQALAGLLTQIAQCPRPALVVDDSSLIPQANDRGRLDDY